MGCPNEGLEQVSSKVASGRSGPCRVHQSANWSQVGAEGSWDGGRDTCTSPEQQTQNKQ